MAADVARKLAAMAADGAGEDELGAVVAALVAGDDIAAAGRWTEETLWEAYGSGAVALYRKAMGQFTGQGIEIIWEVDSSPCASAGRTPTAALTRRGMFLRIWRIRIA